MTTRLSLRLASVVSLLLIGSGCTLYQPRPVTFRVRDGDTGQPVAGAQVKANYLTMLDFGVWFASIGPSEGVTDQDGNLTLVLDPRKRSFHLKVSADEYPEDRDGFRAFDGSPRWQRLVPGPWYTLHDEYEVWLFRGPRPTAEVTVPDGYRGIVQVKFAADNSPPVASGRRAFSYAASPRGVVSIPETALFEGAGFYDGIRARYVGGANLPTVGPDAHRPVPPDAPADDAVALRFVTAHWERETHTWLYVLGTAAEAKAVERSVYPDDDHFDEAAFKRLVESR